MCHLHPFPEHTSRDLLQRINAGFHHTPQDVVADELCFVSASQHGKLLRVPSSSCPGQEDEKKLCRERQAGYGRPNIVKEMLKTCSWLWATIRTFEVARTPVMTMACKLLPPLVSTFPNSDGSKSKAAMPSFHVGSQWGERFRPRMGIVKTKSEFGAAI